MKKKKSKILSSVLIITVVISILLVIYVVPCSASMVENGSSVDGMYYSNHNNYVGLPLDLTVSGVGGSNSYMISNIATFGGLSYNNSLTTGFGNKFNTIPYSNSTGYDIDLTKKVLVPKLIYATSSDSSHWWNGNVDFTTELRVKSALDYFALRDYANGDLTYLSYGRYLRDNLDFTGGLLNSTLSDFSTYNFSYDGVISTSLIDSTLSGFSYTDVLPKYLQLQHYVDSDVSYIEVVNTGTEENPNFKAYIRYNDVMNNSRYLFYVSYTGLKLDSSYNVISERQVYRSNNSCTLNEEYFGSSGFPPQSRRAVYATSVDYITNNGVYDDISQAYLEVLNNRGPFEVDGRIGYNVSIARVVVDLEYLFSIMMNGIANDYDYITDLEFTVIPAQPTTASNSNWNTSSFQSLSFVPLTELSLSYVGAYGDSVDIAETGYDEFIAGLTVINEEVFLDSSNFNLLDWLGNTLGSIMNADIIGNVSVGDILSVALGCGFILLVLKFFSGG